MKLLVNTPYGDQLIIEVSNGGGYFDESLVLWNDSIDGDFPGDMIVGGMVRDGGSLVFSADKLAAVTDLRLQESRKKMVLNGRQLRLALNHFNLRSAVDEIVSAGDQNLKDWYEFSGSYYRTHPIVIQLIQALGYTDDVADQVWIFGATL